MKYPRRHTRITYEGISFMSVLAFIILGSIIRQINLLVLLSGLMIAPFFFNWRISMKMMERLRASRHLPDWANAATPFSIRWQIDNDRARIPAWGIRVIDRVRGETGHANEAANTTSRKAVTQFTEEVFVMAPPIAAGSKQQVTYRCFVPARGIYQFGPADVSTAFPVGLIRSKIILPERQTLVVAPQLGNLTRSWNNLVSAKRLGLQSNQRRRSDHDGEFYAIRPWKSGDSRRQVHWRSSARHNELMVRQLEEETEERLFLGLDLRHHDELSNDDIEFAVSFFATVLSTVVGRRGQVSVLIQGDQTLAIDRLDQKSMTQAMSCLATIRPADKSAAEILACEDSMSRSAEIRNIVISSRIQPNALSENNCNWIDVCADLGKKYFQQLPDSTSDFIRQFGQSTGQDKPQTKTSNAGGRA